MFKQTGIPFGLGVSHIGSLREDGFTGPVPYQYFQF
jgi:hypothetical protein